jgi:hypothetical protein
MIEDLRRLLWRYDAGYFLRELIRDRFDDARRDILRQWRRARQNGANPSDVEKVFSELSVQFERTIAEAERSIRQSEFRVALECLMRSDALFKELMIVQEAAGTVREARKKLDLLDGYVAVRIQRVGDIELLYSTAQKQLGEGMYRSARMVAKLCVEDATKLLGSTPGTEQRTDALRDCIAEQLRICDRMQGVLPRSEVVPLVRGLMAAMDRAVTDRKMALVTLLLEEAQDLTAGALAFFAELDRQSLSGDGKSVLMAFDRDSTDSDFWTDATNVLLSRRLDALARRITGGLLALNSAPPEPLSA